MNKGKSTENWINPHNEMPRKNVPIQWMDSSGRLTKGKYIGVWMVDNGMYIYHTPTFWKYDE